MKIENEPLRVMLENEELDDVSIYFDPEEEGKYTLGAFEYDGDDCAYLRNVSKEDLEKFIATTIHNFKLNEGVMKVLKELGDD